MNRTSTGSAVSAFALAVKSSGPSVTDSTANLLAIVAEHKKRSSTPLDYLLNPIHEKGIYRTLRLDWARGRTTEND